MLRKFAEGKIKKQIIPGSDTRSTIPKGNLEIYSSSLYSNMNYCESNDRNYVNAGLKEYNEENEEYQKLTETEFFDSNMSCADSNTNVGGPVADLKDLEFDEIKLFENYKFKDPSDISNSFEITKSKDKIIQIVNSNCTVLITGVTGCGKSTQVPQYILDDCMNRKKYCNIIVTQPRRIAAISVSKQVNKERGWKNGLLVGYQVGRKKEFDFKTTKILYCTTGILLQRIIKDKTLSKFTHIILDEVHERTLEMDFLLLVIKKLLRTNSQSTRVILMSATADDYKLCDYFSEFYGPPHNKHVAAPKINVSKHFNYNVCIHYLDDLYGVIPVARRIDLSKPQIEEAGYDTAINLVKAFDTMEANYMNKNTSVLIFLPGIFEIEEMHRLMNMVIVAENYKWILIPLHSSITSEEQDRVFEKPPLNYRKIILSTNIAESSITVPDVSYVIDFCLMKQLKNEMKSNYSMLVMTWASKSNCKQRSGRVGRLSDGRVYRLVSKHMFSEFDDDELPEMSRCSLSRIVLMSKILDMGTPKQLLAYAMDPPSLKNIVLTMLTLKQVGALLPTVNGVLSLMDGDITYMGTVMAYLPLEPPMSKLIYFGHIFNILNEAIIMACGLSIKSIFSQPFNKRLEAYTQKLTWANHSCSDPISYIGPYQSWLANKPEFDRNRYLERSWAFRNYIQISAMRELHDLIDDVTGRLNRNFEFIANSGKMKWPKPEEKAMACKIMLAGAFYPNYFVRHKPAYHIDEQEVLKQLNGHKPHQTVYFTGFPPDQPKELYKEACENIFPHKFVGKPTAHFSISNKVYIEFPTSNNMSNNDIKNKEIHSLIPGDISFGVYVALKMNQLKFDFRIPLLKPQDAAKRVKLFSNQDATQQISQQKISAHKCILEEIKTNTKVIDVTVSYFESISYFWVQLFDNPSKQKLMEIWNIANDENNTINIKPSSLTIDVIYIISVQNEKYRGKLISFLHKPQEKYKFLLIDFGDIVELFIEDIFDILNYDKRNIIYSIPALAFQCKIAMISPFTHKEMESDWSKEANNIFKELGPYSKTLHGTIYSIVDNVVIFEDLTYLDGEDICSIPQYLLEHKLACQSEESDASKINHKKRLTAQNTDQFYQKCNNSHGTLKSPTLEESFTMHHLKGPFSPLNITIIGLNRNSSNKNVKIESQSVNSILLDTDPKDLSQRLFVAGKVCINDKNDLTLWDTTMMPNIPGMPAIICLMFSPCVEIRYNASFTKMIGALCGLGYDPETSRPLFEENDIELSFDTVIDHNFLNKINIIRALFNKCVNPEDEEGPGVILEIQHKLQKALLEILSFPTKYKAPETLSRRYLWGMVPKSKLQSPYGVSPINHPMDGADVFKILWGVILSEHLSASECKDILYKLCKLKRIADECSREYETCLEELNCPLCQLTFSNKKAMQQHLENKQHSARYKYAKNELHISYKGPFSDIQHL